MQKGYYKIVRRSGNLFEIKPEFANKTEKVEVAELIPARTPKDEQATIFETDQGRAFGRVNKWPQDTLVEIDNWVREGV